MASTFGTYTLGCKMNYAETETMMRSFQSAGYQFVTKKEVADYFIVNSCSVTESANKKTRQFIRALHRQNPLVKIIVTGCYAQLKPAEVSSLEGVVLVLGAAEKMNVVSLLKQVEKGEIETVQVTPIDSVSEFCPAYSCSERTRAFLKVQDGCNYRCSYCTIPLARGKSRNMPIENLVKQAQEIAARGVKEIVLSGINIGDFGRSTGESFIDLLRALDEVQGIERYRISSIEPNLITSAVIDFVQHSRAFMHHFHIPLQCGSDAVLRLMRRRYTTDFFRKKIEEIQRKMPDVFIGMDVMVGSMGETDEYFEESYNFIKSLNISFVHVFTYSERENTDALRIQPHVQESVRTIRSEKLHALSEQMHQMFCQRFDGEIRPVLFETKNKEGFSVGFTDNYIKVYAKIPYDAHNQIINMKLQYDSGIVYGQECRSRTDVSILDSH